MIYIISDLPFSDFFILFGSGFFFIELLLLFILKRNFNIILGENNLKVEFENIFYKNCTIYIPREINKIHFILIIMKMKKLLIII